MIGKMINRENKIFDKLIELKKENFEFVLIGGYAVSAFNHRFSVDADIVIQNTDLEDYIEIMKKNGFKEVQRKDLESIYDGKFVALKKDDEFPVNFDIMVGSLKCRQTGASWSYDFIFEKSNIKKIDGSERSVKVRIPEKELLIAIKLHSGRLTDVRDIVALSTDIEEDKIKKYTDKGRKRDLFNTLQSIEKIIGREGFENSFKGVFSEKQMPIENIKRVNKLVKVLMSKYQKY